ncbi:hypothetical protein Patl1_04608 [Pistacia atlantica]|uniref:Uncharacterized protein n=1 Tax=Pistacia atlantica TaxID=434234 RepID=A0ACC1BSA4_9ROSI|nr:hypothetical protein Patl1_04608 [Pistacia atlantica]
MTKNISCLFLGVTGIAYDDVLRLLFSQASNNFITSLPEDLANCTELRKLDVEGNKLTTLPDNVIASWSMLTELIACNYPQLCYFVTCKKFADWYSRNHWEGFQGSFVLIFIRTEFLQSQLQYLAAVPLWNSIWGYVLTSNNALFTLPAEIGMLSKLGTFDLHSNQLKEYPVEACRLRLSVLDLSNNSLTGLPPELGKMTSLRKLLLMGNPLRTLRSSLVSGPTPALLKFLRSRLSESEDSEASSAKEDVIAMATRLSITSKELSLEGINLSAVPSEVWESGEIIKLDLSRNSIQELPPELSSCVSLQSLILSRNKIKDWPAAILMSLSKLSWLKMDNNPLRQIPADGFKAVPMLQILDLSYNVASLPENPAFSSLPLLQELYLRRVQLHEIPSDILSLQQLRILDLSQNSLQSIPEGLKNLTSLTELDLSDNNISALPPPGAVGSMAGLLEPSLQALRLDGNPLRSIRRTILDRGTKAVLKYLKDKLPEQ